MSYVYREMPPTPIYPIRWGVGYYNPHGDWQLESEHSTADAAALRVRWLNGGNLPDEKLTARMTSHMRAMERLALAIERMPHSVRMRP